MEDKEGFSIPCGAARYFKCQCYTTHLLSTVNSLYCVTSCLIPFENSETEDVFGGHTTVGIGGISRSHCYVHKSNYWRITH